MDAVTVMLSLGAALRFAVAAALKHGSAGDLPGLPTLSLPGVGRFVGATVRRGGAVRGGGRIVYATTAALLKTLTGIASEGVPAAAGSWQLYVVLVLGGAGVVLTQLAYQSGLLVASLPAITIVNPLLSIVIGVVVYDEDIRQGPGPIAAMTGLLLLGFSVFQLTRATPISDESP